MPFFFIAPVWTLCVLSGIVLFCFQRFRRAGLYAISISTTATLLSFFLSTPVLYLGPRIGAQWMGRWSGVVLMGAYLLAIGIGALIGALASRVLVRSKAPAPQMNEIVRPLRSLTPRRLKPIATVGDPACGRKG